MTRILALGILLCSCLLAVPATLAAGSGPDLGVPTNDAPSSPYFPLSGFHKIKPTLTAADRPALLFLATQNDPTAAVERWALVKALEQFGTFSHLAATATDSRLSFAGFSIPTFDTAHATYRSRYVAFINRDVLDAKNHPFQKLNKQEFALYNRYARAPKPWASQSFDPNHFLGTHANNEEGEYAQVSPHHHRRVPADGVEHALPRRLRAGEAGLDSSH